MNVFEPDNGKEFTYGELMKYHPKNLEALRDKLKEDLEELNKEKMIMCANILSLQGLIKKAKSI